MKFDVYIFWGIQVLFSHLYCLVILNNMYVFWTILEILSHRHKFKTLGSHSGQLKLGWAICFLNNLVSEWLYPFLFLSNIHRALIRANMQGVLMWKSIYMQAIVLILANCSITIPYMTCTVHDSILKITLFSDIILKNI